MPTGLILVSPVSLLLVANLTRDYPQRGYQREPKRGQRKLAPFVYNNERHHDLVASGCQKEC
jgi:hypothetical protein